MTVLHHTAHKNKACASTLAFVVGGLGLHRLYLRGARDPWLWLHLAALPTYAALNAGWPAADHFYHLLPIMVSGLAGCLEALVLGLMPDEKWDQSYNGNSGQQSDTGWPLAVLLVACMMLGAGSLIATIARLFDLLYTGGAYG